VIDTLSTTTLVVVVTTLVVVVLVLYSQPIESTLAARTSTDQMNECLIQFVRHL
jgi:hypothetical protein